MSSFFIDLHCHPQYRPFARSFRGGAHPERQSESPAHKSNLWHYDPPRPTDKLLNYFVGITKFSQNNLTASLYGRLWVLCLGMGTPEKYFFRNKLGTSAITDLVDDFVTEFGKPRINAIEAMQDYWKDFGYEMAFLEDGMNHPVKIDGHWYSYHIPRNFAELQATMQANEADDSGTKSSNPVRLCILPTIEGLHVLNCGLEQPCDPATVLSNARALKQMDHAPWFVTFAHHFYNELSGHARSLRRQIGQLTNQEEGINSGFTPLGEQVLDVLLDNSTGRRIHIDVKHMSPLARQQFLQWRKSRYQSSIPIIISHGVANGLPRMGATVSDFPELGNAFIVPTEDERGGDGEWKDHNGINFYDEELLEMVRSEGILGLQLDERRLANDAALRKVKNSLFRHKIMHYRSELLWKQVQYIGELLDKNGLFAWGHMAIGSDYDGLVDPLNGFWTAEQYDELAGYLERHAYNYFRDKAPQRLQQSFNQIGADELVHRIFHQNAWDFMRRWF